MMARVTRNSMNSRTNGGNEQEELKAIDQDVDSKGLV